MFHILKSTYLQPPDTVNETRPAHLEWLKGEVAAGRIVLAGRLEDETGAILITGDISAAEAQTSSTVTRTRRPRWPTTSGCRSTGPSAPQDSRN